MAFPSFSRRFLYPSENSQSFGIEDDGKEYEQHGKSVIGCTQVSFDLIKPLDLYATGISYSLR